MEDYETRKGEIAKPEALKGTGKWREKGLRGRRHQRRKKWRMESESAETRGDASVEDSWQCVLRLLAGLIELSEGRTCTEVFCQRYLPRNTSSGSMSLTLCERESRTGEM